MIQNGNILIPGGISGSSASNGVSVESSVVKLGQSTAGSGVSDFTAHRYLYTSTFALQIGGSANNNIFRIDGTTGIVSLNTASPNTNATFQIDSTSRGVLIPRMTTAQRDAIGSVISIAVTGGGSGYTNGASVSFTGGSGTGATATIVAVAGVLTSITITNGGSGYGYSSPPTAGITGGSGGTWSVPVIGPPVGLQIFNTTTNVPNYWNGTAWVAPGTGTLTAATNGLSVTSTTVLLGHAAAGTGASDFTSNRFMYLDIFDLSIGSVAASASTTPSLYLKGSTGYAGFGTASPTARVHIKFALGTPGILIEDASANQLMKITNTLAEVGGTGAQLKIYSTFTTITPTFTSTASNDAGVLVNGTYTARATASDILNGVYINNTLVSSAATQTLNAFKINATFTDANSATKNIMDLGVAGSSLVVVNNSGNMGIGTTTPVNKLGVIGNIYAGGTANITALGRFHARASASDGSSFMFYGENSSGTKNFSVTDDGNVVIVNNSFIGRASSHCISFDNSLRINYNSGAPNNSTASHMITASAVAVSTSGSTKFLYVTGNFSPTSGTGIYNQLELGITVNQTGGANGITRSIYNNATITAASDYLFIESTAGRTLWANTFTSIANVSGHLYNGTITADATVSRIINGHTSNINLTAAASASQVLNGFNLTQTLTSNVATHTLRGLLINTTFTTTNNPTRMLLEMQNASTSVWKTYSDASTVIGNTASIDASCILQLVSTTKGFRPPVMTAVQGEAITKTDGLIIYVNDVTAATVLTVVGFWGVVNNVWTQL